MAKLSRKTRILLCLLVWSFLLYCLVFRLTVEKTEYICAVCYGETVCSRVFVLDCKIAEIESATKNIDAVYKKYINEEHTHVWVRKGNRECRQILESKSGSSVDTGIEPPFSFVYIYGNALKMIKESLKTGKTAKDISRQYRDYIEQAEPGNSNLESELRAKYKNIADLLNQVNQ